MRQTKLLFAVACVTALAAITQLAVADDHQTDVVVPPQAESFPLTDGEWSAGWWQWLVSIPAATNPNLVSGKVDCGLEQSGPMWFLAGSFGDKAYTRICTIPSGKDLLVTPLTTPRGRRAECRA